MVNSWLETTLGEVLELKRGYDLPQRVRRPGTVPVVSSSGISDYHAEAKIKGPGVVTGRYGTIGEVYYIEEDFWPHNTTLYVRDFKGNDPRFISYFLRTINYLAFSDKAAVPGVNRNHRHMAKISFPPVSEQKAIAAVLSAFDDKIELNRQMNTTLEEMARALFKSWFVDFDPVRRNQEARLFRKSLASAQPYDHLFPDRLVVDGNGRGVPEGWRVSMIGKEVDAVGGGTPSTKNSDYWEGGTIKFTTPKDFSSLQSPVLLETARCITEKGLNKISSGLLPVGTVLMSSRAPVGYLAINEVPVAINQGFIAMLCNKTLSNYYVLFWAMENMHLIEQRASGTTFREISKQNFRPIEVVVPPKAVVEKFDTIVGPLYQKIVGNEKESRTLVDLRDTLLPRLMSGRLRVGQFAELPTQPGKTL
jgi:type I restriction enzyme, S subunit